MSSRVSNLLWTFSGKRQVSDVCNSSTLYPWEEQYPLGSNFCPLFEYTLRSWVEFWSDGFGFLYARWPCSSGAKRCTNFSRRAFSDCAIVSFAVRVATWIDISEIVFVNSATEVVSACVAIAIFDSARVWSCYILAKIAALVCVACTFDTYTLVFEVLDDLQVSLKAWAKWALKLLQVL